jgi:hypothetical protein
MTSYKPSSFPLNLGVRRLAFAFSITLFANCAAWSQGAVSVTFTQDELKALELENLPPEVLKLKLLMPFMSQKRMAAQPVQLQKAVENTPVQQLAPLVLSNPAQTPELAKTNPEPTEKALTEDTLSQKISSRPKLAEPVVFKKQKDGFDVNGQRFVDPEGRIGLYGFDSLTGDVTYIAQAANRGEYLIKNVRVNSGQPAITIARARETGNGWNIVTETGKTISGSNILPGSQGFLVTRTEGGSAFLYVPGKDIKNITIPQGYQAAAFQNGDVSSTRYMLIEKLPTGGDKTIESIKALGSLIGVTKKDDYALLDIDSGLPLFVNIASDGKESTVYSDCSRRTKNSLVNLCKTATSYETLYDPKTGLPNFTHYYWRLYWYKTPDERRVVISQQGGLSNISIVNMDTGSSSTLFERLMGIAGFSSSLTANGKIEVIAKMGFTRERIDDALAVLDGATPVPVSVGGLSLF